MKRRKPLRDAIWGLLLLLCALPLGAGCGKEAACRPGTLFVQFGGTEALTVIDTLAVTVFVDNVELHATVTYKGGDSIEIEIGDRYKAGQPLILSIAMLANDNELWRVEQPIPSLPAGCSNFTLFLPAVDLGGPGADLTPGEPDQSVPQDLLPPKKNNAETCASGDECATGFCIDGRCCNSLCDGQCEACDVGSLEGVCAPVIGAPHGGRTACAGTAECAGACTGTVRTACTFPQPTTQCRAQSCTTSTKTKAAGCDGAGACLPEETITCPQGCSGNDCLGACTDDLQCANATPSTPYCDSGVCTAGKPKGRTCTANNECTSGQCADGFCCSSACDSQCDSCKEAGIEGTCVRVTGAPRTGGAPDRTACVGSGVCAGQCDGTSPDCQVPGASTTCGSQSCASGQLTTVGGCSGGSCVQNTSACTNGNCSSGTECGPCTMDAQCGTGKWCNSGACANKVANGTACSVDAQCTSGNCEDDPTGTSKVCCAANCTGGTPRCKANGSACQCTSSSCGSGAVCNPTTLTCCGCSGCRSVATCGGACSKTCTSCCGCGASGDSCCSGQCP